MHKRASEPERNERVALITGDSSATRRLELIGPCNEMQKPAKNMIRTERKRMVGKGSSFYTSDLKAPAFMYFAKAGAFAGFV